MEELTPAENQVLLEEYLERMDSISSSDAKKPFVVVMTGLPGSGKSTFAKALAGKLGLCILRNDDVRRFLNSKGFAGASPIQSTVEFINTAMAEQFFSQKISHIIDADMIKFHTKIVDRAASADMELVTVRIECNDETLLARINERERHIEIGKTDVNQSMAGREILEARKRIYESTDHPAYDFVYDSTTDLTSGVNELVSLLRVNGLIN